VHEHDGNPAPGHQPGQLLVVAQAGNVVDDVGARVQCALSTSFFRVSTDTITSESARSAWMTGITRRISSSAGTGSAPGRVDSPPTSTMSTPAEIISCADLIASLIVAALLDG